MERICFLGKKTLGALGAIGEEISTQQKLSPPLQRMQGRGFPLRGRYTWQGGSPLAFQAAVGKWMRIGSSVQKVSPLNLKPMRKSRSSVSWDVASLRLAHGQEPHLIGIVCDGTKTFREKCRPAVRPDFLRYLRNAIGPLSVCSAKDHGATFSLFTFSEELPRNSHETISRRATPSVWTVSLGFGSGVPLRETAW